MYVNHIESLLGEPLFCHIKLYSTWTTKTGSIACKDVSNREKLLLDSIFSAIKDLGYSLDDKQVYMLLMTKNVNDNMIDDYADVHLNLLTDLTINNKK